jgi:hypothetical protein
MTGCLLFLISWLSFEVVFWTFLIIHGEIKVILALYTAKEEEGAGILSCFYELLQLVSKP